MASKPKRYSPELRAEVVKAVLEGDRNYAQVARDFDLVPETVRTWVKRAKEDRLGKTPEARDAAARARVAELERRVKELEQENSFLKKCATFFAKESE
ncbi:MAG: transposase [Mycobacterium sp.]|nr:transposase [Mycobacterium sp.]